MPAKNVKKTSNFNKKSVFETGWDVEKTLDNDPRFGQCFLLQHVEKNAVVEEKRLLMKEYLTSSEGDAKNMCKTLEERQHLDHPHIQRLHDWASAKKSDFCSTYYKFKSYYTWPVRSLADDYTKLAVNEGLNHEVLTHVMYQMLQALDFLHSHGKFFNDVRPEYIGHLESSHSFILCDRLNYPGDAAEVQRQVALNPSKRNYMSPQMWRLVNADKKAASSVEYDRSKGDTWALGMVLLMGGLNKSAKEQNSLYVRRTKQAGADINCDLLQHWLTEFSDKYDASENHILGEIVRHCLEEDEHRRPSAHDLLTNHLPDYARVCEHFGDQDLGAHHHVVVEHHEPRHEVVHHEPRHEVVHHEPRHEVVHHEPRHEVVHHSHNESRVVKGETVRREPVVIRESHHGEPTRNVTKREPEIRREYIDIHGNKSNVAPVHDSHHQTSQSHVHQEHRPVNNHSTVVRHEPTVVHDEHRVEHHEPTVVRHEPTVVRHENRVEHHEPTVVRHEGRVEHRVESNSHHHANPTVIRRSVHDSAHRSNVVRTSGNVIRRSVVGDNHHNQATTVRRSHVGEHSNVTRRSVHGAHHGEGRVVSHVGAHHGEGRVVSHVGAHHGEGRVVSHVGAHHGETRVVSHRGEGRVVSHHGEGRVVSNHGGHHTASNHGSTVRRITDPEEIRRIKEKNSGVTRVEEHVERVRGDSERVEEVIVERMDAHENFRDHEVIVEHHD
jgi:serine/threonine protein kinase